MEEMEERVIPEPGIPAPASAPVTDVTEAAPAVEVTPVEPEVTAPAVAEATEFVEAAPAAQSPAPKEHRRWPAIAALIALIVIVAIGSIIWVATTRDAATTQEEEKTDVTDANGNILKGLPVVGNESETAPVDTTTDPRTPPTFAPFSKENSVVMTWKGLVDAVDENGATWYIDAVNNRASSTGFGWADIQKWANDPQLVGSTCLSIQVFGDIPEGEARRIAADYIGAEQAAQLPLFRHEAGRLINTRGSKNGVSDFLDRRMMVRVSLSPIIYDEKGKVLGVSGNSGVFADCLNIWRLAMDVPTIPGVPSGNGGDLTPKSANPADYPYPPGKPIVPTVLTPPEATPPYVPQTQPGGGSIVDTPTNLPGSESGVTAPGATPPTSTPNSTPVENGVNPYPGGANSGDPGLPQ